MALINDILKPWKFYRFTFTGATRHLRYVYVSELRLYESSNAQGTNISIGATATSNGNYSTTTTPDKAIDNLPNTGWESAQATPTLVADPRILTIELPTAKLIKSFQIECNAPLERPTNFKIAVSNDGVNWIDFGSYANFFQDSNSETIATANVGSYLAGNASLINGNRIDRIRILRQDAYGLVEVNSTPIYELGTNNWVVLVEPAKTYYVLYEGPQGYRPMIDGPITSKAL